MSTRYPKTVTAKKQAAQAELMHGIGKVLGYWVESPPFADMTEEEEAEFHALLLQQADRVAKMFGYEEAWSS